MRRLAVLGPVWLWLLVFVAAPVLLTAALSFSTSVPGVPPFSPLLRDPDPSNYAALTEDAFYLNAALKSLLVAAVSSAACLVIGYPMALAIARSSERWRSLLLLLVMLPFWTGFLLRVTAWIGLLRDEGWINAALSLAGLGPVKLLYTDFAMYVGITYAYLPFMILPLYARLSKRDPALEEAAADLGASPWVAFWTVTWPLSVPGVVAGLALVFIPAVGEYVIPELLGGPGAETIGRALWNEFFANRDWPMAATVATALLAGLLVPMVLLRGARLRRGFWLPGCLVAGYAFLYVPVALLVATSFNPSRLTTVLSGFSLRWYGSLWGNATLIEAAGLSLRIAAVSATGATALGLAAGYGLARFGRFRGRGVFAALLGARLVLPDVLVGLSLLLLFVQLEQMFGWPAGRGALTITLAHVSVSLSYVAVVVEARLRDAGTELEEAAMDLGASPLAAFLLVTLPLAGPALVSGWLLAFTLSLDDLVVATFVSGPGSSTLPMVVFSALKLGVTPELNALATVILVVVSVVLFGALWVERRVGRADHRRQ